MGLRFVFFPGRAAQVIAMLIRVYLVAQLVKNPPAKRETWVRSLGCEDPLEKEIATHSSILTWEIPWTEDSGGLPPELLGPGKSTKRRPNRVCASEDYPSA